MENNVKFEQLSDCKTLLARMRNLLQERDISIPPSIREETETHLQSYKRYLNMKIDSKKRELEEDLESVNRSIELLPNERSGEALQEVKNEIKREIQELSTLDGEDVLANPEWT